jgi:hypothetical protein
MTVPTGRVEPTFWPKADPEHSQPKIRSLRSTHPKYQQINHNESVTCKKCEPLPPNPAIVIPTSRSSDKEEICFLPLVLGEAVPEAQIL